MADDVAGRARFSVVGRMVWAAIFVAALYWIAASAVHTLMLHGGSFGEELFAPSGGELWSRIFAAGLIVGLGICTQLSLDQRRRTEEEMQWSEARYRNLIADMPVGIYRNTPGPRGKFLMANRAAAQLHGYGSVDEFMRTDVADLYADPADREAFAEKLKVQGGAIREELRLRTKDGRAFWGAVTAHAVRNGSGEIEYFDGVIEDISARKEAEDALKESSEKYRALFESSRDAVILSDRERILDCNPASLELLGCASRNEVVGRHPSDFSPPSQPDGKDSFIAAVEHIENAYETGNDLFEWVHRRAGGEAFPATVGLSLVRFNDKQLLQAVVRDISERKWIEKALADEKELLSVTLGSIGDGVISTNCDGYIVSLNRAAENLTGWREREALGMPLDRVFYTVDEETRERRETPVKTVLEIGKTVECDSNVVLISRDGSEWHLGSSAAPVRDRNGTMVGAVLVFRDASEKRASQRTLEKRTEDLRRAVRELDCLYSLSRIAEMREISLEDIFRRVAEVVRFSWRKPECTCARLVIDGREYATDNFEEAGRKASSDIKVDGERIGAVEVRYLEEMAEGEGDDLAREETSLLGVIAERLGGIIERHRAQEAADAAALQWRATFDAIPDMVALLDRDSRVVLANRAMFDAFPDREVVGAHCYELFHGAASFVECCPSLETFRKGKAGRVELQSESLNGRWLSVSTYPIVAENGEVQQVVHTVRDITERKLAEGERRSNEEWLRTLVDSIQTGVVIIDPELHKVVEANEVALEMLGLDRADLIGHVCHEYICSAAKGKCPITDLGQTVDHSERALLTANGREVPVLKTVMPVMRGAKQFLVESFADITELKKAEQALRESEGKLRAMLGSLGDHMSMMDRDLNILWANDVAKGLFGDEIIGRKCYEVYHGRSKPCEPFPCLTQKAFEDGQIHRHETQVQCADGKVLDYSCTASVALRDDEGNPTAVIEVSRDVTEHKQAERALKESAERHRALFAAAVDGILIADIETQRFIHANRAICEMLGYTEEELLGLTVSDIHPEDSLEHVVGEFEAQVRGEKTLAADMPCLRKDGVVIYADINTATATIDGKRCNVGFFRDITERKRMERELGQDQKLRAVGQLAAGIAHEINTPTQYVGDNLRFLQDTFGDLESIMETCANLRQACQNGEVSAEMFAELDAAMEKADIEYLKEEVPKALEESLGGVERVTKIVLAMKEFSHPGSGEKSPSDINKAIESTVTVARNEWKYVADLEMELDPDMPSVPCMIGDFNQVVLNMIVNAAHAIGGVVGDGSNGKGKITIGTRQEGNWAEIRISDTGGGIPKAVKSRIFEPFFTTKEVGKGTGQGLAIAHDVIVEKHGGSLTFETEEGKGTTFVIRLPLGAITS